MDATRIRIGVVGAGANTRSRHIPGLQAQSAVTIASVCNRSRQSSEQVASQFGIERVCERWEDLVADPQIDAVVIGTWPNMHCPVTVAALAAGKHVMCEARMARDAAEAQAMLQASRQRPDLVAQVVPSPFSLQVDRTIVRLLGEGYLGELLGVRICDQRGQFPDPDAPLHWREDRQLSGLNVMSLGIWYEALMRWLGPALQVTGFAAHFVRTRRDPAGVGERAVTVPDYLDVSAQMACGAVAQISLSAVPGLVPCRKAWLYGTEGTLEFDGKVLRGGRRGDTALQPLQPAAGEAGGWRVEEEFINAIRGLEPISLTTFADGLRYMAFTEAVYHSCEDGRSVEVAAYLGGLLD